MRLSLKAAAIAGGVLWGGAILLVELVNLISPGYGLGFLQMLGSVYPWFHPARTPMSVTIGTLEGFLDGAIAALLFAWLYNTLTKDRSQRIASVASKPNGAAILQGQAPLPVGQHEEGRK
jgi:hypothetical protein